MPLPGKALKTLTTPKKGAVILFVLLKNDALPCDFVNSNIVMFEALASWDWASSKVKYPYRFQATYRPAQNHRDSVYPGKKIETTGGCPLGCR